MHSRLTCAPKCTAPIRKAAANIQLHISITCNALTVASALSDVRRASHRAAACARVLALLLVLVVQARARRLSALLPQDLELHVYKTPM